MKKRTYRRISFKSVSAQQVLQRLDGRRRLVLAIDVGKSEIVAAIADPGAEPPGHRTGSGRHFEARPAGGRAWPVRPCRWCPCPPRRSAAAACTGRSGSPDPRRAASGHSSRRPAHPACARPGRAQGLRPQAPRWPPSASPGVGPNSHLRRQKGANWVRSQRLQPQPPTLAHLVWADLWAHNPQRVVLRARDPGDPAEPT